MYVTIIFKDAINLKGAQEGLERKRAPGGAGKREEEEVA